MTLCSSHNLYRRALLKKFSRVIKWVWAMLLYTRNSSGLSFWRYLRHTRLFRQRCELQRLCQSIGSLFKSECPQNQKNFWAEFWWNRWGWLSFKSFKNMISISRSKIEFWGCGSVNAGGWSRIFFKIFLGQFKIALL